MNLFSVPTFFGLVLVAGIHVQGAVVKQEMLIQRAFDDSEVIVDIGKSDRQDEVCVKATSPVTCDSNAADYGKRKNVELQPNKDPAPDRYDVTVKDDDATAVCVKRIDSHENPGWGQELQISCKKNVCTCTNGKLVDDAHCAASGETCTECSGGFTLVDGTCNQNTCTCDNGTPQTESWCTQDKAEQCKDCDEGFHFDALSSKCTANKCRCDNGTPQTDKWCTQDNAEQCKDCEQGFHFDAQSSKCFANKCKCDGGIAQTDRWCTTDGAELCKDCNSGWHKVGGDRCDKDTNF